MYEEKRRYGTMFIFSVLTIGVMFTTSAFWSVSKEVFVAL